MAKFKVTCRFCSRSLEGEKGESSGSVAARFLVVHNEKPVVQGDKQRASKYCIIPENSGEIAKCLMISFQ